MSNTVSIPCYTDLTYAYLPPNYKQVILVNNGLGMRKGKTAAQVAHAAVKAAMKVDAEIYDEWDKQGHKKVVLSVDNEKELIRYFKLAEDAGLPCALIIDQGLTQIPPNSMTCLAIGPATEGAIDIITGEARLMN